MRCSKFTAALAGLCIAPLLPAWAAPPIQLAQSATETGQSGVGVRGTTGETSGGGQTAPGSLGDAPGGGGATGGTTGAQGMGTGTEGGTTMGQPPGAPENHLKEATKHAEAAATSGKKGDASTIAKHARMAKTHVEAALKDQPGDEHLNAALKSLDAAIFGSERGEGDKARQAAKDAVNHLKMAK